MCEFTRNRQAYVTSCFRCYSEGQMMALHISHAKLREQDPMLLCAWTFWCKHIQHAACNNRHDVTWLVTNTCSQGCMLSCHNLSRHRMIVTWASTCNYEGLCRSMFPNGSYTTPPEGVTAAMFLRQTWIMCVTATIYIPFNVNVLKSPSYGSDCCYIPSHQLYLIVSLLWAWLLLYCSAKLMLWAWLLLYMLLHRPSPTLHMPVKLWWCINRLLTQKGKVRLWGLERMT